MKKYILAAVSLFFIGCGGGETVEKPLYVETNNSITTYRFDISNAGGEVEVKYTSLDNKGQTNFLISHEINGVGYNTYYPTAFYTGNLMVVSDTVYIPANTTENNVTNTIKLNYISDAGNMIVSYFTINQSTFAVETKLIVNVNNNNEINNTIINNIDLNVTNIVDTNTSSMDTNITN